MVCLITGIIAGQPLWYRVSRRINKKNTVLSAILTILAGIALFSVLLALRAVMPRFVSLMSVCVTIIIVSCGMGCLATMPISMFADCIYLSALRPMPAAAGNAPHPAAAGNTAYPAAAANTPPPAVMFRSTPPQNITCPADPPMQNTDAGADARSTPPQNAATAMGFLTLCTKLSNALIMFLVGIILDAVGFVGGGVRQTQFVANALGAVLVAGVALSCVISWVFYSKYSYTKNDFDPNI
jgi:Na+/melibiose symporter-like transporter